MVVNRPQLVSLQIPRFSHSTAQLSTNFAQVPIIVMKSFIYVGVFCFAVYFAKACTPSATRVGGYLAPQVVCSGELVFEDNFDSLDQSKWRHEMTMSGGGNWEFQWYVNDRFNSYTVGGKLHIKPSFTADIYGEDFLTSGRVFIPPEQCTQDWHYGCDRTGSYDNIINPIRSARLTTTDSFFFTYGTLEVRAKMPAGDWLWPALWMMPKDEVYGQWPRSGEIDLSEMRGNRRLYAGSANVGVEQVESTLHWGPSPEQNGFMGTHWIKNQSPGFHLDFHTYKVVWGPTWIEFIVDNVSIGRVNADDGFWRKGGFESSGMQNPWGQGSLMAPFDQPFFIILNLAVGGVNYFMDDFVNYDNPKPWHNTSPRAAAEFWRARSQWEPTWNLQHTDDSHLQVDYVRVYAL